MNKKASKHKFLKLTEAITFDLSLLNIICYGGAI